VAIGYGSEKTQSRSPGYGSGRVEASESTAAGGGRQVSGRDPELAYGTGELRIAGVAALPPSPIVAITSTAIGRVKGLPVGTTVGRR
jgi:hypothetical protein